MNSEFLQLLKYEPNEYYKKVRARGFGAKRSEAERCPKTAMRHPPSFTASLRLAARC